ncbi:hypothetical protein EDF46_0086 [Frondihabitans sp. PhB188]|uniref:hypothetical protein n=1 Tax=Frondihabitans sp. PhB188 TaxID=2485200 RepID=UPI000F495F0A|nr:hypothetical protein [Frondihabitans sp. PhB188]ROQ40725.1 hypothetical protein EDF46_0086 [Frondihabitans sp. PhB188]
MHTADVAGSPVSVPARRPPGWPSAVASVLALLCAGPVGWLVLLAILVPADRGEESAAVALGIVTGSVWAVLVVISALLAFAGRRRRGAVLFVPPLLISLAITLAPLVAVSA